MSGRDDAASLVVTLMLVICACSLAVHFVAEGLSPVDAYSLDFVAGVVGHTHLAHEHGDDNFVIVRATPSSLEHSPVFLLCPMFSSALSYSVTPLLPPPNF